MAVFAALLAGAVGAVRPYNPLRGMARWALVIGAGFVGVPVGVSLANVFTPTGQVYPWLLPPLITVLSTGAALPPAAPALLVLLGLGVVAGLVLITWPPTGFGRSGKESGLASFGELRRYVRRRSSPDRAPLTGLSDAPLGWVGRRPFTDMLEDLRIIIAPTGAGKTVRLVVRLIRRATGPVVTTSTKPDVLRLTAGIRMKRFPKSRVIVFDPEEMTSWPDTVRWNIVAGCEDGSVAMERAKAIVAARPLTGDSTNSGFFSQAVTIVLQCMLHAAAVGGYTMRDVMTWMNDFSNETPYNVLSDHPAAIHAWQALLVKYCRGKADETVSSMDMSASGILNAFAVEKILDAVCPGPGHMLDLGAFHTSTDTLYLLCKGESSPVASVFTALVESLLSFASDAATRSVTGYLDPPLNAVLDEAANVCPIPSLPTRMSAGRGEGVVTTVVIQDRPQLEQRYAKSAGTILNNATEIIALGGLTDVPLLKDLSDLAGDVETRQPGTAQTREKRALSIGEIRTVKDGDAVLFYRTMKPAILTLRAWWQTAEKQEYVDALEWAAEQEAPIRDRRNAGALT